MKKINSFFAFCLLMVFLFACKVDLAFSQPPYDGDIYIILNHARSSYLEDGIYNQYFLADINYPEEQPNVRFEDFIVTTTVGDIIFPPNKLKDPNETMVLGTLQSPMTIERFNIIKAVAKIGGAFYDVTKKIIATEPSTFEITVLSEENRTCPPKVLDFIVAEGTFDSLECPDFCHTMIEVNGQLEDFFHSQNLAYFFENDDNLGKKIKFNAVKNQIVMYEDESADPNFCRDVYTITHLIVLPR
ncbi:MAG: hypothetical protein LBF38_08680 [Deltaproteobacteria bacterium]|jgi:hypothetical protein|nr:hypothetical protein [Deltaproteobacteria bacterium]